jgi:hypothetical protein
MKKYNKVIGIMEHCEVGDDLWVKADDAESELEALRKCVLYTANIAQELIEKSEEMLDDLNRSNKIIFKLNLSFISLFLLVLFLFKNGTLQIVI